MDSRRARARVRLTDYTYLSMSERTLSRLEHHSDYPSLLDVLRQVYGSSSANPSDLVNESHAITFLEERRTEEDIVLSLPEDALDYLLDAAIDRFRYSARDVLNAVFNYREETQRHQESFFTFNQKQLQDAVFANDNICHRILTINPVEQGPLASVHWKVDFKSTWVAKNVMKSLDKSEDMEVRRQINLFRKIPGGQSFARWLREPFAHDFIANATGGFWPLINMKANDADPLTFTLDRSSPILDDVHFVKCVRETIKLQSIDNLCLFGEQS